MPRTLIVPVDGSEAGERALECARVFASRLEHCDVLLLSVDVDDGNRNRSYVDDLAKRAGLPVRTACVTGDPAGVIIRAAHDERDAAVCMATHARGRVAAPFLGSVATEVVRGAGVPVVLVGPHCASDWWHEPARLVVCWIGEGSDAILAPAREWSADLGMELSLLSVFHPLDVQAAIDEVAEFAPALEQLGADAGNVQTVARRDEFPAAAIAEYADELPASMLALTTRARGGVGLAALGSVAMDVVHRSPTPVLVVRGAR